MHQIVHIEFENCNFSASQGALPQTHTPFYFQWPKIYKSSGKGIKQERGRRRQYIANILLEKNNGFLVKCCQNVCTKWNWMNWLSKMQFFQPLRGAHSPLYTPVCASAEWQCWCATLVTDFTAPLGEAVLDPSLISIQFWIGLVAKLHTWNWNEKETFII